MVELTPLDIANQAHVQLMFDVRSHPEVDIFLIQPPPKDFSSHTDYLKKNASTKEFFIIKTEDQLCGYCQVEKVGEAYELGWALHPDFWGKGIGKKSIHLLVEKVKVFGKPMLLRVKNDNEKAIAIYKREGFIISSAEASIIEMKYAG